MNYYNTLISISDDCPVREGTEPLEHNGKPTVAMIQYGLVAAHPYEYTQEELLFETYLRQKELSPDPKKKQALFEDFTAKPQPCLRASPLPKKYGWGIHFDENGRTALISAASPEYRRLSVRPGITVVKAMRSAK